MTDPQAVPLAVEPKPSGRGRSVDEARIALVQIIPADRAELERGLWTQGYSAGRAAELARSVEDNDGALQMLARHRLSATLAPDMWREAIEAAAKVAERHQGCLVGGGDGETRYGDGTSHSIAAAIRALPLPAASDDDPDEAYELGKCDGRDAAMQELDVLTGGDGEYVFSTLGGDRHCPDADTMRDRIVERCLPTASDGWVMVPRVPTEAMLAAGANKAGAIAYRAMIAAAPTPPLAKDQPHD